MNYWRERERESSGQNRRKSSL